MNAPNYPPIPLAGMPAPHLHDQIERTETMQNQDASNIIPFVLPAADSQCQPPTKNLMLFIVGWRKNIRRAVAILETHRATSRGYRRRARILRQCGSPFDGARICALEAAADDLTDACAPLRESLKECGQQLARAASIIDAGTTLAQRCEILNVNLADRKGLTEADGVNQIVFGHALEDSAARRGSESNDGPMYQALQQVFMDFLTNTREGRKLGDSLWEPGGIFARTPAFIPGTDSKIRREPPRLRAVPDMTTKSTYGEAL